MGKRTRIERERARARNKKVGNERGEAIKQRGVKRREHTGTLLSRSATDTLDISACPATSRVRTCWPRWMPCPSMSCAPVAHRAARVRPCTPTRWDQDSSITPRGGLTLESEMERAGGWERDGEREKEMGHKREKRQGHIERKTVTQLRRQGGGAKDRKRKVEKQTQNTHSRQTRTH